MLVIDQGNFCIKDNSHKYADIWKLANLPKPTESHFNGFVDFISNRSFKIRTNSKSSQNSRSIAVLDVYIAPL